MVPGAIVLWLAAAVSPIANARDFDRSITLHAIHTLENPYNVTRPGPRGELGAYQFRESTWRRYTDEPFARALDRDLSDKVAVSHYEWLRAEFQRAGLPVTTYNIALAWNGGLTSVLTGRASKAAHDYAQRAENLAAYFSSGASVARNQP